MSSPVQSSPSKWPILMGGVSLLLLGGSFGMTASYTSSADSYERIKDKIWILTGLSMAGALFLGVTSILYYMQNPQYAVYFIVMLACVSIGLSLAALSVAAISR